MSEETIIIQTEVVKVSDLQGREKQIYDHAYNKGLVDGDKSMLLTRTFAIIGAIIILVGIVVTIIKNL